MYQKPLETPETITPKIEIVVPPAPQPNSTFTPSGASAPVYGNVGTEPQGIEKVPLGTRKAVLCFAIGPAILILTIIIEFIRPLVLSPDSILDNLVGSIAWFCGLAGVLMLIAGSAAGIYILAKSK